ncbi:MAG: RHS repeat protein [Ruminococcaceae bacterium]|nr:RHS repeat protein [Oscillospiraceae bacterium]
MKKLISLFLLICLLSISLTSCGNSKKYNEALDLLDAGEHEAAYEILKELGNYKDSEELLKKFRYVLETIEYRTITTDGTLVSGDPSIYTYTSDGLLSKNTFGERVSEFIYDKNKNLIKTVSTDGLVREYSYDDMGNVIKDISYSGETPMHGYEYSFDKSGNMIKKTVLQNMNTDFDYLSTRFTVDYTYDENGKLITALETSSNGSEYRVDYIYDENGRLIREDEIIDDGMVTIVEYAYDESDKILKETNYYNEYVIDYTYDAKGNLVEEKRSGKSASLDYTYEYIYDENGLLVRENQLSYFGSVSKEVKITVDYTYDDAGNLIKKILDYKRYGMIYTRTYLYDTNGNLIEYSEATEGGTTIIRKMTYKLMYVPYKLHETIEDMIKPKY